MKGYFLSDIADPSNAHNARVY